MPEGTSINGTVYLDVLKDKLPPFMNINQCTHFQHAGAPCHQTKYVKTWIAKQGFQILGPWPGNSPYLNPIENCWVILKRKVAERNPTSLSDLRETLKQVWITEITPDYYEKLCISMPDRIQAVLEKKKRFPHQILNPFSIMYVYCAYITKINNSHKINT